MSRLTKESEEQIYEPPILNGLDSLNSYLTTLDGIITDKIKTVEKSRPKSFSNEEESLLDGFIDEHIIGLGGINQILIESVLVAYYSYFERKMVSICVGLDPHFETSSKYKSEQKPKLKTFVPEIIFKIIDSFSSRKKVKANSDLAKYRKFIFNNLSITDTPILSTEWNKLMKFHLMRKFIVHANIKSADYKKILAEAKSNEHVWFNEKTNDFSISIEYVKEFSRSISAFISELDYQLYLKESPYRI
ncbi:MAG: hypothetical protein NTY88_04450 [Bacteroidetes bacterium]|nr:hypothetical protein [Bacteroidota bacterium]